MTTVRHFRGVRAWIVGQADIRPSFSSDIVYCVFISFMVRRLR